MCLGTGLSFQKLLMKTGLVLIVIGHLSFISGALVHGTVLRYVANPQDAISLQYAISNIVSVTSAILVLLSRHAGYLFLSDSPQKWAVFSLSVGSTLLSLFCSVGLAVSIILTFTNKGQALLATCTFANVELIQISHECSFDPTRVYVSGLFLPSSAAWGRVHLLGSHSRDLLFLRERWRYANFLELEGPWKVESSPLPSLAGPSTVP
uniref:Transmembrane protein 54 n=1 Tax=Chelydra serpentina TaxID=8475 RepID=A0A8C3XST6_CHESE